MSYDVQISAYNPKISGTIHLSGSKSISNRVLMIQAMCNSKFRIENLSDSDDTKTLERLLSLDDSTYDTGHAGTTFRFLTAFLAFRPGTQILTGSDRMIQRPVKALVDALNSLGANITYLGAIGYPPLKINEPSHMIQDTVHISANISSQYISALLMIAPTLPKGLKIILEGEMVSKPYLDMTLSIMKHFEVNHHWNDNIINIAHQNYVPKDYYVEADWSAASYFYSLAALSEEASIDLVGLSELSMQGDAAIKKIAKSFGVSSSYINDFTLRLSKSKDAKATTFFEYDFIEQPDLAQTIFVMCAALGIPSLFKGLETLHIKETDRIEAMKMELSKLQVFLSKVPGKFKHKDDTVWYMLDGKAKFSEVPIFDTYHDHRMAMSLAPLALLNPVIVKDAGVVSKSYPNFWKDFSTLGLITQNIE